MLGPGVDCIVRLLDDDSSRDAKWLELVERLVYDRRFRSARGVPHGTRDTIFLLKGAMVATEELDEEVRTEGLHLARAEREAFIFGAQPKTEGIHVIAHDGLPTVPMVNLGLRYRCLPTPA